jgi:2',3'-cyclic-nucleotide 2'-phosphodiesterase (5'-nucleotidase family)
MRPEVAADCQVGAVRCLGARLAEQYPGIDVMLSSDMHEETREPVVTKTGTIVVEEGQDGTMLGELNLKITDGRLQSWRWTAHTINNAIPEDPSIARAVRQARKPFVNGPDFVEHVNPLNGARLTRPIDTVVGYTKVTLDRHGYADTDMPALIEGSAHDFLADAFRVISKADVGAMRGFRYGTVIPPGPIKLEDLYHFVAIGPEIGVVRVHGRSLKRHLENSVEGSLDPNPANWTGGWLFGFSGLTFDLDPYRSYGFRVSNIRVNGKPLDPQAVYSYAGYWYPGDPEDINGWEYAKVPGAVMQVLRGESGEILDGTDIVVRYLESLPNQTADPLLHRIHLLRPLPRPLFGFPEVQPLHGAKPN